MINKLKKHPPIVDGVVSEWLDVATYLGVDLDKKLSFRPHIDKVVARAKKKVASLYCLFRKNSPVSIKSKLALYRSIIRPGMTYACPVFNNCPKTHFNRLQIQQNKCLRMALNAPYYTRTDDLHIDSGIPTMRDFVDKQAKNFYDKTISHSNALINQLGTYKLDDVRGRVKHRLPKKIY